MEVAEDQGRDNPLVAAVGPWVVLVAVGALVVVAAAAAEDCR